MLTAELVKEIAHRCGADLVGIGSIERFDGAPREYDPRSILPEARSVVGLGFRVHRGLLRGIEEGTFFAGYPGLGYSNINDVYAPMVLREVGNLLEDHGYEAVLYSNTSVRPGCGQGRAVAPDRPRPSDLSSFVTGAGIPVGGGLPLKPYTGTFG